LLEDALSGRDGADASFVRAMTPIVRHRVARALRRHGAKNGADTGDLQDLTQEVWASLFANEGRALRGFSVSGGLSLENFVGLIAYRRAVSLLRARTAHELAVALDARFEPATANASPEARAASRELVREVLARLGPKLSTRDLALFEGLFLREAAIDELYRAGMKANAVHTWKSRLTRRARAVLDELEAEPSRRR
jgi:DNA-directed RNA polymerase specialized sigma24 family protein